MTKVSIGFRGWRFDEEEVFDENGDYRPLMEIEEDTRQRLVRLPILMDMPCDACYLIHGDDEIKRCREPTAVYGEPLHEVLVCDEHERDFYYWYQEAGGSEYRGEPEFQDAFHEWFADGNRAPDWYDGPEHVETDPEETPDPDFESPDPEQFNPPDEDLESVDLRDVDLGADYPTSDE